MCTDYFRIEWENRGALTFESSVENHADFATSPDRADDGVEHLAFEPTECYTQIPSVHNKKLNVTWSISKHVCIVSDTLYVKSELYRPSGVYL